MIPLGCVTIHATYRHSSATNIGRTELTQRNHSRIRNVPGPYPHQRGGGYGLFLRRGPIGIKLTQCNHWDFGHDTLSGYCHDAAPSLVFLGWDAPRVRCPKLAPSRTPLAAFRL